VVAVSTGSVSLGSPPMVRIRAAVTARNAEASIDNVMCRYQPCQVRTWYWSRPVSFFPV
jgi:hypothetical protein